MKKLFFLIVWVLISSFSNYAQNPQNLQKSKYFKYTTENTSTAAIPLFAVSPEKKIDLISASVDDGRRQWDRFTTEFINKVLKKYLTVEEMRKLLPKNSNRASAYISLYFDFYGNIIYANFIFKNEAKNILTDEKLYNIYRGLMDLKIDTVGFHWWVNKRRLTTEQQSKAYGATLIPFFFKTNCP